MICAVRASAVLAVLFLTLGSADAQERTPGSVQRPLSRRNANYSIDVRLDARAHTLTGRETLIWTNSSNTATRELRFHLYYNAWRNDQSTFMKEQQLAGGWSARSNLEADEMAAIDISSLKVTAGAVPAADLTSATALGSPVP